ncbi:MAG: hypothetical protein IK018_05050 [Lachnospiraceae bacterium]|nr:hypothetical protein [Lachnospiraceae bacterium]
MKKTIRTIAALALAFVVCYASVSSSYAYVCSRCWSGQMAEVCGQQKILLDSGEHSYGFLGRNKCYAKYYKSRGGYVCPTCFAVEEWKDSNGGYLYHLCYESHSKCSKGEYDVCQFIHP